MEPPLAGSIQPIDAATVRRSDFGSARLGVRPRDLRLPRPDLLRPAALDVCKHGPDLLVRQRLAERGHVALVPGGRERLTAELRDLEQQAIGMVPGVAVDAVRRRRSHRPAAAAVRRAVLRARRRDRMRSGRDRSARPPRASGSRRSAAAARPAVAATQCAPRKPRPPPRRRRSRATELRVRPVVALASGSCARSQAGTSLAGFRLARCRYVVAMPAPGRHAPRYGRGECAPASAPSDGAPQYRRNPMRTAGTQQPDEREDQLRSEHGIPVVSVAQKCAMSVWSLRAPEAQSNQAGWATERCCCDPIARLRNPAR